MKSRTWLLLRGLGREKAHWGPFVSQFQQAFPNDIILPEDLPGSGEFRDQNVPLSMREIMESVRKRISSQDPVYIFALSLGGMVAIEYLRHHPNEVATVVLINSSLRGLSPWHKRIQFDAVKTIGRALLETDAKVRESSLVNLVSRRREGHEAMVQLWVHIAKQRPVKRIQILRQLFAASRFSHQPAPPRNKPALLLCGLGDRLVDPSCSEAIHDAWGFDLMCHPWGGHELSADDPQWVLTQVLHFLQKYRL